MSIISQKILAGIYNIFIRKQISLINLDSVKIGHAKPAKPQRNNCLWPAN
jgi:hypothetical protein